MGGRRRRLLVVGFAVAMALGIAVYLKLWAIDYAISANDPELLRRQFDLANREAMDESAEWRMRYDIEADRAVKCDNQLIAVKDSLKKTVDDDARIKQKMATLEKENLSLMQQMKVLKEEVESTKKKCRSR